MDPIVVKVNAEFHRITTVNLEAKFMFKLDHYTPKLLAIFQAKKGAAAERHRAEMNILLQNYKLHQNNIHKQLKTGHQQLDHPLWKMLMLDQSQRLPSFNLCLPDYP
ncbi:hypothetical protein D9C73_024423 [Collichthys lucidus]|uniref:Uncharacterized protein n=1 Tax=Collichthys lucidus TaxID=240159 RepID=A0A4V6AT05_COLLU|nr:hypothetical protein D9C73_024423 [Collichthys lucidus]